MFEVYIYWGFNLLLFLNIGFNLLLSKIYFFKFFTIKNIKI